MNGRKTRSIILPMQWSNCPAGIPWDELCDRNNAAVVKLRNKQFRAQKIGLTFVKKSDSETAGENDKECSEHQGRLIVADFCRMLESEFLGTSKSTKTNVGWAFWNIPSVAASHFQRYAYRQWRR